MRKRIIACIIELSGSNIIWTAAGDRELVCNQTDEQLLKLYDELVIRNSTKNDEV